MRIFVICNYIFWGVLILVKYLLKPETHGPWWFVVACEIFVIVNLVGYLRKHKNKTDEE